MNTPLTKDELTDLRNWSDGEFSDPRPTREMVRRVLGMLDSQIARGNRWAERAADATARAERAEESLIHANDRAEKLQAIVDSRTSIGLCRREFLEECEVWRQAASDRANQWSIMSPCASIAAIVCKAGDAAIEKYREAALAARGEE